MSEDEFTREDRESLIAWIERRGGTRKQAEIAAKQLIKKAVQLAEEERVAPIEAMGSLLSKIVQAEKVMEENGISMNFRRN